jgi:hypothetical protein
VLGFAQREGEGKGVPGDCLSLAKGAWRSAAPLAQTSSPGKGHERGEEVNGSELNREVC